MYCSSECVRLDEEKHECLPVAIQSQINTQHMHTVDCNKEVIADLERFDQFSADQRKALI